MASHIPFGYSPGPYASGESQSQDGILRTHFSPQHNGYSWNIETSAQSLHYAYHPTTTSAAPSPNVATLTVNSSYSTPPQSPSQPGPAEIELSPVVQSQDAVTDVAVPEPEQADAHQIFAPPILGQHASASRRSKYSSDWDTHRETIRRLYMDEEKSLKETMEIMALQHGFHSSEKLYEEKFKKWGYCKYLSGPNAQWMWSKANSRRVEEQKETIFVLGGRVWTTESVEKRAKRAGIQAGSEVLADAPTPMGITYGTPRNVADHPSPAVISQSASQRDVTSRWTPTPDLSFSANQCPMRVNWNGFTTTEAMAMFRDAQDSDRQGDAEGAEKQFRHALGAFVELLSPTHEDTKTAAYYLASFYARRGRMREADNILDWMTEKHMERWGLRSRPTVDHVLCVVDLLNRWFRPQDALAFVEKAKDCLWQPDPHAYGQGAQQSSDPPINGSLNPQTNSPILHTLRTAALRESASSEIVDYQLRSARAHVAADDPSIEPLLLSVIAQCEQHHHKFAAQNLRAIAELIELYGKSGRLDAAVEEHSKAYAVFLTIWRQDGTITKDLINASLDVAAQSLKLNYSEAEEMFHAMQDRAVETLGPDHKRTIWILIRIGLMYQNANRWKDAQPRFEQALAASMTANGLEDALTKSLEAALENEHYSFLNSDPEDFVTIVGSRGVHISPI